MHTRTYASKHTRVLITFANPMSQLQTYQQLLAHTRQQHSYILLRNNHAFGYLSNVLENDILILC